VTGWPRAAWLVVGVGGQPRGEEGGFVGAQIGGQFHDDGEVRAQRERHRLGPCVTDGADAAAGKRVGAPVRILRQVRRVDFRAATQSDQIGGAAAQGGAAAVLYWHSNS